MEAEACTHEKARESLSEGVLVVGAQHGIMAVSGEGEKPGVRRHVVSGVRRSHVREAELVRPAGRLTGEARSIFSEYSNFEIKS